MKKSFFADHLPLFEEQQAFFSFLIASKNLGHAYLFFGDEGIGKFTFAYKLASFLEKGNFSTNNDSLIDFLFITSDENGSISIDESRRIKNFLSQTPLRSFRRVVVIDNAHTLTPEAQSALLKIIEEPPIFSLIILISSLSEILFPPLLSRVVKIYFPRLSFINLKKILNEYFNLSEQKSIEIARFSYGRISRAKFFLEQKKYKNKTLSNQIEEKIIQLRENDIYKNSSLIFQLLLMHESIKRFSINPRIQEKALDYILRV